MASATAGKKLLSGLILGTAGISIPTIVWSYNTYIERVKLPERLTFTLNSADDVIQDRLQTGDLIFFNRKLTSLYPIEAFVTFMKKQILETSIDHVGIIIDMKGKPMLLETTRNGMELHTYEERILTSKSNEIILLPLRFKRTPEMKNKISDFVMNQMKKNTNNNNDDDSNNNNNNDNTKIVKRRKENNIDLLEECKRLQSYFFYTDESLSEIERISSLNLKKFEKSYEDYPDTLLVLKALHTIGVLNPKQLKESKDITIRDLYDQEIYLKRGARFGDRFPIRT